MNRLAVGVVTWSGGSLVGNVGFRAHWPEPCFTSDYEVTRGSLPGDVGIRISTIWVTRRRPQTFGPGWRTCRSTICRVSGRGTGTWPIFPIVDGKLGDHFLPVARKPAAERRSPAHSGPALGRSILENVRPASSWGRKRAHCRRSEHALAFGTPGSMPGPPPTTAANCSVQAERCPIGFGWMQTVMLDYPRRGGNRPLEIVDGSPGADPGRA